MIFTLPLFFAGSAIALQHAYLEALLHKAFDTVFGKAFVNEFLTKNTFIPDDICKMDLKIWSQNIPKSSSIWLSRLGLNDFGLLLKRISVTVSTWKDVIRVDEPIVCKDLVEECASKCKLVLDTHYSNIFPEDRTAQAKVDQLFLHLVYRVQVISNTALLGQARYFELLNRTSEQMERACIDVKNEQVLGVSVFDYDKVSDLARMLLTKSEAYDLKLLPINPARSVQYAKEALKVVNYARFNRLRQLEGHSKETEEAMIGVCHELHTYSSTNLKAWTKGEVERIIQPILTLNVFLLAVKSIEMSSQNIVADSSFFLPLSLWREIKTVANDLTLDEMLNILQACQEYREVARLLDDFARREGHMSVIKKSLKRKELYRKLAHFRSITLPSHLSELFNMHVRVLSHASEYLPELVHFSNMPMDETLIGLEAVYLQKLAYWINEVTKVVPEERRKEHIWLMITFITQEIECLFPKGQRELSLMTMILMLDGGLKAYFNESIN